MALLTGDNAAMAQNAAGEQRQEHPFRVLLFCNIGNFVLYYAIWSAFVRGLKEIFDIKLQELTYCGASVSSYIPLFLHKIA